MLGKCSHIDYRCWSVLKDLCTLHAPHLLYSSEADYKELKVNEQESKAVIEPDLEPPVLIKPDIIDEAELEP